MVAVPVWLGLWRVRVGTEVRLGVCHKAWCCTPMRVRARGAEAEREAENHLLCLGMHV